MHKYYIGIGQQFKHYKIYDKKMNKVGPAYPLIQIDPKSGYQALKCPDINGGKWIDDVNNFALCNKEVPVAKGHTLSILILYIMCYCMLIPLT